MIFRRRLYQDDHHRGGRSRRRRRDRGCLCDDHRHAGRCRSGGRRGFRLGRRCSVPAFFRCRCCHRRQQILVQLRRYYTGGGRVEALIVQCLLDDRHRNDRDASAFLDFLIGTCAGSMQWQMDESNRFIGFKQPDECEDDQDNAEKNAPQVWIVQQQAKATFQSVRSSPGNRSRCNAQKSPPTGGRTVARSG